ncbi:MAG: hypothetical protein QM692_07375 [Thermomicrobiales bacterium]
MDSQRFDMMTRRIAHVSRRDLARLLGGGVLLAAGVATTAAPDVAVAKRPVRGEHNVRGAKAVLCVEGVTRQVAKKRRRALIRQGATRGECAVVPGGCPTGQKVCNGGCIATTACCTDADCVSPATCVNGSCVVVGGCITTADCPAGQACLNCMCADADCTSDSVCGAGNFCDQGQCLWGDPSNPCVNSASCINPRLPVCNTTMRTCEPTCVSGRGCTAPAVCDLGVCTSCGAG